MEEPPAPTAAPSNLRAALARLLASDEGDTYTWRDGEHKRRVRVVPGLTVQASTLNSDDDLVFADDGERSIVQRGRQRADGGEPVFMEQSSGELMTLPGGVLLAFEPDWTAEAIDRFFADNGIAPSNVSNASFTKNAFFVETAPGLPSLQLANALADQEGVILSSPNWRRESYHR